MLARPPTSAAVYATERFALVVYVGVITPLDVGLTRSPTVSTNVVLVVVAPSVTLRVIVEVPDCPEAGVIVTVRLAPEPPSTMLAVGITVVLLDVADVVNEATAVSASATVKAIAPVAVLLFVP